MWLYSNIFVTKAIDSIDAYSHLGGDAAAFVSHSKDASGVRILHKLDVDGIYLLGHTVVDWQGERWVCQSTLPGIFTHRKDEEDWVKVDSTEKEDGEPKEKEGEKTDNQLIVYGLDSEDPETIHWDEASHRVMEKVANAHRLAAHTVMDGKGQEREFYASAEVKALKGTDGRRYMLDLPRLSPVDIEWLEKDIENYPHRVVLLRPELLELFWESELKRYARSITKDEEEEKIDPAVLGEKLKDFDLKFNADAFVDYPSKGDDAKAGSYTASTITDESEPSIKAVRDASQFLRSVAVQAVVVDCLTGNLSGIMDGQTLTRHLHSRGINIRYLGLLLETIGKFAKGSDGEPVKNGHLATLERVVKQEMVYRGAKHALRKVVAGLSPVHVPNAISHFLNCLFGAEYNPKPVAAFEAVLDNDTKPSYTSLTPDSLHQTIITDIEARYRHKFDSLVFRPRQLLRELASRFAFQLQQRDYVFEKTETTKRTTIFEPSDVLTLVPVVRSTAPTVNVAEEIFEAGRNTIARGNADLGLEFMAEAISLYENIHSVIHPEVASAYNQYSSTLHQLARLKIQQLSPENLDPEQPLGIDIGGALRLQRQAVIIAERTLGVYHADTVGYYFNLAMLENLEGNALAALRYFKHCLTLWDIVYGEGHPEINTILVSAS
jgi:protein TIF31